MSCPKTTRTEKSPPRCRSGSSSRKYDLAPLHTGLRTIHHLTTVSEADARNDTVRQARVFLTELCGAGLERNAP